MTDMSACGRMVFHIPWCPDFVSLIRHFVFTFVFDLPTSHGKKKKISENFRVKGFQTRIAFSSMTTHVLRALSFEEQFEAKSIAFRRRLLEVLQK